MKTAFRDVKEYIRGRIVKGDWAPGDLIPNEVDLAAEFQCARATVAAEGCQCEAPLPLEPPHLAWLSNISNESSVASLDCRPSRGT